ncbi:MAG: right-handed parallel beta-helix repeat-containing protein, partial [Thermoplasmata archaeon]|nr:right-handed parallel beta-helix repeat-containing protein [Thermoplasmata archaeon]
MKKRLYIAAGIIFISILSLLMLGENINAQPPNPVWIDENDNGVFDAGEWNGTSIQDAIDNATQGQTIYVESGTYYENIIINKSINLFGKNRDAVIIDGGGVGDVIYINKTSWVNLSNFTVKHSGSNSEDAGIEIYHCHNITIRDVNVSENEIGMFIKYSSDNTVSNNNICNNGEEGILLEGADIAGYYTVNNSIRQNTLLNNTGRGIKITLYCENNLIFDNICNNNGYDGIYVGEDYNYIKNNTCSNNTYYGIHLLSNNNDVANNSCYSNLRGIYFEGSDYNHVHNNTCSHNQYGIFVNLDSKGNNISNNICVNNSIAGIYIYDANNNIIENGMYSFNGCGIWLNKSSDNTIRYADITLNREGVKVAGSFSGIILHYNNISGNKKYGINNTATVTINAEHNWWGDATGPYDPSNDTATGGLYNPTGLGDNVTDYVDYYPWWDSPSGSILPSINDNTPSTATTGDPFTFNASVVDNIGVSNVYVEYWYGTGSHTNVSMNNVAGDYYEYDITIPDTLETLHYIISALDSSGNWNNTGIKDVTISDDDLPSLDADY